VLVVETIALYSDITDLVDIPKVNFGMEYILEKIRSLPRKVVENEDEIIAKLISEFDTTNPLPTPVVYITGITMAIDEILHHKRPITHIQGKVSPYSYAVILQAVKDNPPQTASLRIVRPARLQRLKTFRASNSRVYAVALITGNHTNITDCYSLTFVHDGDKWVVASFHLIGGANGSH
jgi:hypothetical protein